MRMTRGLGHTGGQGGMMGSMMGGMMEGQSMDMCKGKGGMMDMGKMMMGGEMGKSATPAMNMGQGGMTMPAPAKADETKPADKGM